MHSDVRYLSHSLSYSFYCCTQNEARSLPYQSRLCRSCSQPLFSTSSSFFPPSPPVSFTAATRPWARPQTQNASHTWFSGPEMPFRAPVSPYVSLRLFSNIFFCERFPFLFFFFFWLQKKSLPLPQSVHLTFLTLLLEQSSPSFRLCCVCVSFSSNRELLKEFR